MAKTRKTEADVTPSWYRAQFHERLIALRESLRRDDGKPYSQADMAQYLGVSTTTYSKYETRSLPPVYLLVRIIELSQFDPWYVLTGQAPAQAPTKIPERPPAHQNRREIQTNNKEVTRLIRKQGPPRRSIPNRGAA